MKLTEEAYNIIQEYLRGELTDSGIKKFNELSTDKSFLLELRKQSNILRSLNEIRDDKIRAAIQEFDTSKNKTEKTIEAKKKKRNLSLLAVIIIGLLFTIFTVFYLSNNESTRTSNNQLYAELYNPYPINGFERGDNNQEKTQAYKAALTAYANKNYDNALKLFDSVEEDGSVLLYKGICLMETNNFAEAQRVLSKLYNGNWNSDLKNEAEWYLVLIQLTTEKITKNSKQLNRILEQPNHPYFQKAQNLNSKI